MVQTKYLLAFNISIQFFKASLYKILKTNILQVHFRQRSLFTNRFVLFRGAKDTLDAVSQIIH